MKWYIEAPKESGWYWVRPFKESKVQDLIYLDPNLKSVWVVGQTDPSLAEWFHSWSDKLEIPE